MFDFVGLDIRVVDSHQQYSADATVWVQDEELYENVQSLLGVAENPLQLLEPRDQAQMLSIVEMVKSTPKATLVSFELPKIVFDAYQAINEYKATDIEIDDFNWIDLGYDVCDINGFFSYLDMNKSLHHSKVLFDDEHLIDAFILAQAANIVIPSHSPFIVIHLKKLSFDE